MRLVQCVNQRAVVEANKRGEQRLVPRATQALVELARSKGRQQPIDLKEIVDSAGIETTAGTKGLYPWLKRYGADVVVHQQGTNTYIIKDEFYDAMLSLLPASDAEESPLGIMRLRGLGKEIWAGIDAQDYVNRERASWGG